MLHVVLKGHSPQVVHYPPDETQGQDAWTDSHNSPSASTGAQWLSAAAEGKSYDETPVALNLYHNSCLHHMFEFVSIQPLSIV